MSHFCLNIHKVRGKASNALSSTHILNLKDLQPPNAIIMPGMIVSTIDADAMTLEKASEDVTVASVETLNSTTATIKVSQSFSVAKTKSSRFRYHHHQHLTTAHTNMLRNTGDLEDTYVGSSLLPVRYTMFIKSMMLIKSKMLFTGHSECHRTSAMPVAETNADHTHRSTGQRPRVKGNPNQSTTSQAFYAAGRMADFDCACSNSALLY